MGRYTTKKLSAVCSISSGNTAPQDSVFFDKGSFPFFRTSDVGKIHLGTIYKSQDLINAKAAKSMRLFPKGTVLFPKSGASVSLNHRVKMGVDGYVVSHLATIKANNDYLTDDFLLYYLMTIDARSLLKNSGYPSINISDLSNIMISFPSIDEQTKIAGQLDKVQELIALQKNQLKKLDDLIKSRFIDIFGDPITNPKGWPLYTLHEIATLNPSRSNIPEHTLVSFIPMDAVSTDGHILYQKSGSYASFKKGFTPFIEGDILFAKITPCMENGKGCIATQLQNRVGFGSTEFHVVRPNSSVNTKFLFFILQSRFFRRIAACHMTGSAGQRRVPISFLETYKIVLPPKSLQTQFAEFVTKIESQKGLLTARLSHLETLYKSLMQEYFG